MTNFKKFGLPLMVVALIAALFFGLNQKTSAPAVTFTTIQGQKINMADLRGKVVLVNFWATDCPSCVQEMPELVQTYNTYKAKGFEVIAVAMPYDPPAQVLNYATQKKLPFPVMHDGLGEITHAFVDVKLTPTAYIFDKAGNRVQRTVGTLDFVKLRATLDELLVKELG